MKKLFYLILCILLISYCTQKEIKEESVKNSPKDLVSQIIFEDVKTYGEFREKLQNLYCEEDEAIDKFESLVNTNNVVVIYEDCPGTNSCYSINRKNMLTIWKDSIKTGEEEAKGNAHIPKEFKRQYQNNGQSSKLAARNNGLIITIALSKNETIEVFRKIMNSLISTFKRLNLEYEVTEFIEENLAKLLPNSHYLNSKYRKIYRQSPQIAIRFRDENYHPIPHM